MKKRQYTYDLREFQLHCTTVLDAIDKTCHEHGLTYYIIAGTLLGAVRHKGFIPWDDDIDIALSRTDYDTLIAHSKEWLPERYNIVTADSDLEYPKFFAKIEDKETTLVERFCLGYVGGVYIDIFPLDDVPNSKFRRDLHFRKFHFLRKLTYFAYRDPYKHGKGLGAMFMVLFQKILSKKKLHKAMHDVMCEYHGKPGCDYVMTHDDGFCAYHKSTIAETAKYEFEGRMFDGPADAKGFLSSYYGDDFMQLPPMEKRRSHFHEYCDLKHGYVGVDINTLR